MPTAEVILASTAAIADQFRLVASAWHVVLGSALVFVIAGWRPSVRLTALAITAPLMSVSLLALLGGNPFNAVVFAALSIVLVIIGVRLPRRPVPRLDIIAAVLGLVFVAFGMIYPHFLVSGSLLNHVFEAPFGVIPCPTLSVVAGLTIMLGAFESRAWLLSVATATSIYGLIGFAVLHVDIDLMLIAAAMILMWQMLVARPSAENSGAARNSRRNGEPVTKTA